MPVTAGGRSIEVVTEGTLELSVSIRDFNLPLSEVTWERVGGDTLTDATLRVTIVTTNLTLDPAFSTFTLETVQSLVDQGEYRATASNPAGNSSTTFDVTVLGIIQHS